MSAVMKVRNQFKEGFEKKNGLKLSFMSFFARAAVLALEKSPDVNASIDGDEIVYHDFIDLGIAVGTDRGLVVPVLRGANKMSILDLERGIADLAAKARAGKLSIPEMSGGTFTISNGGTYGSLLSTPILTPPQSGILGMHNIVERPMAVDGKVVIRPMMYLALSYDHRLIDGKGAVTFLVTLKDLLEHPEKLGLEF
jgi:2-oxoglutarate dehydrogenase E2 component (dihydrolipoamide succinyltransferase)